MRKNLLGSKRKAINIYFAYLKGMTYTNPGLCHLYQDDIRLFLNVNVVCYSDPFKKTPFKFDYTLGDIILVFSDATVICCKLLKEC